MRKQLYILLALCCVGLGVLAQKTKDATKLEAQYRAESEEMRQLVWGWKDPKFSVRDIPAKYANASKVIIAQHTEFNGERKSKWVFKGIGFANELRQSVSEITRMVIKLNDKRAVDEFSELSYTQFEKKVGFSKNDVSKMMVGVRVIKADGRVQEINADEVVFTQRTNTERKARLAIPDLVPGDIIDFYVASITKTVNNFDTREYYVTLFDDAPVLSYSFHGELSKRYGVRYRTYNGAPKLKVNTNEDDDLVMDISSKNVDAFETSLWVAPTRQLPFLRMFIKASPPKDEAGIQQVSSNAEVMETVGKVVTDLRDLIRVDRASRGVYKGEIKAAKEAVDRSGVLYKDLSDTAKAAALFYMERFNASTGYNYEDFLDVVTKPQRTWEGRQRSLCFLYEVAEMDPALLVGEDRKGFRLKETMDPTDLQMVCYLPALKRTMKLETIFDLPFSIPEELDGVSDTRMFQFSKGDNMSTGPKLPMSTAASNAHLEDYAISLDLSKLAVGMKRKTTLRGYNKLDMQRSLVLFEEYNEAEAKLMGQPTVMEEVKKSKNGTQRAKELANAYAEARRERQEAFLSDIKDWFELEVKDMKDARVDNMGIRHDKPDLVYSAGFVIEGILKKAGNNYILEIGKLLGKPLTVKEEQRKRTLDVYSAYARSIEQEIILDIPEGYSVEGVAALNTSVKNETGFFTVEAIVDASQLKIRVKKHYLRNFEPVANFAKLNEFMDAASNWTNSKVLIKKK
jgi:hypothetical protein